MASCVYTISIIYDEKMQKPIGALAKEHILALLNHATMQGIPRVLQEWNITRE